MWGNAELQKKVIQYNRWKTKARAISLQKSGTLHFPPLWIANSVGLFSSCLFFCQSMTITKTVSMSFDMPCQYVIFQFRRIYVHLDTIWNLFHVVFFSEFQIYCCQQKSDEHLSYVLNFPLAYFHNVLCYIWNWDNIVSLVTMLWHGKFAHSWHGQGFLTLDQCPKWPTHLPTEYTLPDLFLGIQKSRHDAL